MTEPLRPPPSSISGVVFDCDGLLVDSESRWTVGERRLFQAHGMPFGAAQKALCVGRSVFDVCEDLAPLFGRPGEAKQLAGELMAMVKDAIAEEADPMPGAAALARTLAARVPVGVASNSPRDMVDAAMNRSGMSALVPVGVAADEVARPKPAPDVYLAACAAIGADPARAVAFEDSPTGAAAARAAGMYVIVVPSEEGQEFDCDWQLDTLEDPALHAWADAVQRA